MTALTPAAEEGELIASLLDWAETIEAMHGIGDTGIAQRRIRYLRDAARLLSSPRVEGETLKEAVDIALAESMKAPQSLDHPWDRGYRAGAAAVWAKLRDKLAALSPQGE